MTGATNQTRHLRWPADRFYWAVLDGGAVGAGTTSARGRQRLGYLFENVLPGMSIEDVHAVYRRIPGNGRRYIACGVARQELEGFSDSGTVSLTPATLPPFVDGSIETAAVNLLSGRYEPRRVRRLRGLWTGSVVCLLAVVAGLVLVRLERSVLATKGELSALSTATQSVYEQVLGANSLSGVLPPEQLLVAERRRLEQTRSVDVPGAKLVDCSLLLGRLLSLWPDDLEMRTESIAVLPEAITIRVQVSNSQDAQVLADAVGALSGWRMSQPQTETRQDEVDVTLRFSPSSEGERGEETG